MHEIHYLEMTVFTDIEEIKIEFCPELRGCVIFFNLGKLPVMICELEILLVATSLDISIIRIDFKLIGFEAKICLI